MQPINPQLPETGTWRDFAKKGFSLSALENLLRDTEAQPDWRTNADLNVAYYDGKQLTEAQKLKLRQEQLDPRVTNLVSRVINSVLGQEAKARSDVRIEADDDNVADVVDVFNMRLKEAQRESFADMAVSNGYGSQVKAGIGWVGVSKISDPMQYPYLVEDIHRNDMWWDWRARDVLYRDARWMVRKQWKDLDELEAAFPEHKQVLRQSVGNYSSFMLGEMDDDTLAGNGNTVTLARDIERVTTIRRSEWMDTTRKRVKMYEVWYRVPASATWIQYSPTRRVLYDENNPLHHQAVASDKVKVFKSLTSQVRVALFAGPHRLLDRGTNKKFFPYVPFLAFRDDNDASPYGLIEGMRAPQDAYNERRNHIQWMLKARQIVVDNDALDQKFNTFQDLSQEAMRPDMLLVLEAARRNPQGVKIGNDLQFQKEHVDMMLDDQRLIQDVPGVYSTQLGEAPSGVKSGLAINSLVEQGMVSMGELNDNYRHGRRLVFEHLLDLIVEDHTDAELETVVGSGAAKRIVVLNTVDENGEPINQVKDAPIRVGLSDVPATPAFKMQQQQQIATIISALQNNPQAIAVLSPAFIEQTSIENAKGLADDLRRVSGIPTAADRKAAEQQQAQQMREAQQAKQLMVRGAVADVHKKEADARLSDAKAIVERAKVDQVQAQTEQQQMANDGMVPAEAMPPTEDDLIAESLAEAMQPA